MTNLEGLCDLACEITGDRCDSFCFIFAKRISWSKRNDRISEVGKNERIFLLYAIFILKLN